MARQYSCAPLDQRRWRIQTIRYEPSKENTSPPRDYLAPRSHAGESRRSGESRRTSDRQPVVVERAALAHKERGVATRSCDKCFSSLLWHEQQLQLMNYMLYLTSSATGKLSGCVHGSSGSFSTSARGKPAE